MALQQSLQALFTQFTDLRETFEDLKITIQQDRPKGSQAVLIDEFGDTAQELVGWAREAQEAMEEAQHARLRSAPESIVASLILCGQHYFTIHERFYTRLLGFDRVVDFDALTRERTGEWEGWRTTMRDAMECCRQSLALTAQALLRCWQELAERNLTTSVYVEANNAGQRITLGERDLAEEHVT